MFFQDSFRIGFLPAINKGINRESLKLQIKELKNEYLKYNASMDYILTKYDDYSIGIDDKELVNHIRKRLINNLTDNNIPNITTHKNSTSNNKNIIYVLQLEQNKIYIGKTKDLNKRFNQHLNGKGSVYTNLYKPISIIENVNEYNEFDEDNYVKRYMKIYGINNVRGGSYSNLVLSRSQIEILNLEITHSENKCFKCGNLGHYSNNCIKI